MEDKVQGSIVENPEGRGMVPRKKVLLSFVGMRDPYNDNNKSKPCTAPIPPRAREDWGSILTICDELQPDIVFLFPSSKEKNPRNNTEGKAEKVKAILMEKRGERSSFLCNILPLDIQDATDFEEISLEIEKKMDVVVQELIDIENYEFHLNCSSGTQQMTAVGYVLANSGRLPNIVRWQCKDPERLRSGEARTRRVNATFLEESVYRKKWRLVPNDWPFFP